MGCMESRKQRSQSDSAALLRAAVLIQRWHRRHLARLEMRRRCTWNIFQSLEYASEQDQVELYKFFNDLLTIFPEASKGALSPKSSAVDQSSSHAQLLLEEPDKSYTGPHLRFPLTKKDVDILIDLFRRSKSNSLHPKYVGELLSEAAHKLERLPNLAIASTAISKQITVVGDLHGKLEDLLVIFHKNGLPSIENPYVFNGDFVDRGKKGLEVFLLILACFLAFPGSVFPNRGNHEDTVMNARYGFIREVQTKYKNHADILFKFIEDVYRWLPLGTLINNRVLVVHGGISDTTNLDLLKRLNRGKYVSILRPPYDPTSEHVDKTEWKQIFDIMWSDPQVNEGCVPNTTRGAGTFFGPDITWKFLSRYRLNCLIRSHECKPEGYEFMHDERVITIFSASNYYAAGSNRGAYMKLNPQMDPYFVQFVAAVSKTNSWTFDQKVGVIEASAIKELGARLRAQSDVLEKEFLKHDPNRTGFITSKKWCEAMEAATNLALPWHLLREKLAPGEAPTSSMVNYNSTLDLLETDIMIEAEENEVSVAESLYKNKSSLEAIFHILDKDHSGHISLDEFADACDLLERHLGTGATKEELLEMCKMMDINGDGLVDLNEFLEAFRLCGQTAKARKSPQHIKPDVNYIPPTAQHSQQPQKRHSLSVEAAATRLAAQTKAAEPDSDIDPADYEIKSMKPQVEKIISLLRVSKSKEEGHKR